MEKSESRSVQIVESLVEQNYPPLENISAFLLAQSMVVEEARESCREAEGHKLAEQAKLEDMVRLVRDSVGWGALDPEVKAAIIRARPSVVSIRDY